MKRWASSFVIGLGLCAMGAEPANACGAWSMESPDKRLAVRVHWQAVEVVRDKRKTLGRLAQKEGIAVQIAVPPATAPVTIDGGVLRRGDVVIGSVAERSFTLGDARYNVEVADSSAPDRDHRPWVVTVKRNDVVILSGRAMSLLSSCTEGESRPQYPRAIEETDIRNRVALALAAEAR